RPPAVKVLTISLVVSTKFPAERRLFIQDYKQMHTESNSRNGDNCQWVGMSEGDPQPDPAYGKPHVHGIAHMAVEADAHQPPRGRGGGVGGRSPAPPQTKTTTAPRGNGEPKQSGEGGPQPQRACPRHFDSETEPLRQKPEPQRGECRAYRQSGDRGWQVLLMR